ncbi:DNA polymerase family A-domain-containing protein [Cantharellus anzutake]|uniref:DNA polymerase family A-domain-containing protein n=1 Tax=Cantharellus anzutake TaxID=1750568 RepID=UPI001908F5B9|nr:DNA polymerase family A-domain-containing protein [Cantharellus anzutake]KAF8331463.1 DNA polymerase family A-domain-containing protein [Cantharellus anzutake]
MHRLGLQLSCAAASPRSFYDVCKRHAYSNALADRTSKLQLADSCVAKTTNAATSGLVPRNEVGVQLLSNGLHSQIFQNVSFPPPDPAYVQISRDHLAMHGLDTSQGSTSRDASIELPPLQGEHIDHHFHRLGKFVSEPAVSLAKEFASLSIPSPPENWVHEPGWTRYNNDGSYEHLQDLSDESMLCFDVETMPRHHHFPVMACAASPTAWYSWLSPWLLGQDGSPAHLVPLGNPKQHRIVVGHNVAYDRARIADEYHLERNRTRFLDTMSLHVAAKGITSHQRPSWMSRRRDKEEDSKMKTETLDALQRIISKYESRLKNTKDKDAREKLFKERDALLESLSDIDEGSQGASDVADGPRWEDLTSVNSLAEVARLYCGVEMEKDIRNDFMKSSPEMIRSDLDSYLNYCAFDVSTTHAVYQKVYPIFLSSCPHPVTFAGITVMGSSILPVNKAWDEYIKSAEGTYRNSQAAVFEALCDLAREARELHKTGEWVNDPWLRQLDWTMKPVTWSRVSAEMFKSMQEPAQMARRDSDSYMYGWRHDGQFAVPLWYLQMISTPTPSFLERNSEAIAYILALEFKNCPLYHSPQNGWVCQLPEADGNVQHSELVEVLLDLRNAHDDGVAVFDPSVFRWAKVPSAKRNIFNEELLTHLSCSNPRMTRKALTRICKGEMDEKLRGDIIRMAQRLLSHRAGKELTLNNEKVEMSRMHPRYRPLDWDPVYLKEPPEGIRAAKQRSAGRYVKDADGKELRWPSWYIDLASPKPGKENGVLDLTPRKTTAALLLRLSWMGWPLFISKEHGWTFRVDSNGTNTFQTRTSPLSFSSPEDQALLADTDGGYSFYKLPHKDGEKANVGNPLTKTFVPYLNKGTLSSPSETAKKALQLNADCSYWISARDRIISQMVVRDGDGGVSIGIDAPREDGWGFILPQVITMGTVTRRAIERTWLTASNAKKNRVGSELKAMVRAPPGYAIVGADVDSEELWISSLLGDAQFGLHGASALGWMTLEGTKSNGTDLHSKTAKILGTSRDQAKVFNYSRIYGAGIRHAELLLIQANPNMHPDKARQLAKDLYASTKGRSTHGTSLFNRKFWYGGTESFVFNKLEEVALSNRPVTPALGCRVTEALLKENLPVGFGTDFMTSRINWVVQSSGVDYLHLLIVSMEYLCTRYNIRARYMISVHDELRYLVREEDKYRAALALQIANLWTRSQFAYRLGFDNLPQGVAFFSAVDVDHILRKEVDMTCITPSNPNPIPPGECLDIYALLKKVPDGLGPMSLGINDFVGDMAGYLPQDNLSHRAKSAEFLLAQATRELSEIKHLDMMEKRRLKEENGEDGEELDKL